ncbi:winged helix-turn-helix transcriptional regulator [Sinanaerobacter sp. ZZT-01]|uniref:winged helix-turn-helix transcriptional regulator n=1 Tax=Sinanaerobacter sp. ZZT-01 TaxID=3111540 RepID=UPI002D7783E5|nr:winged helix-turn-helix transcriptional regulator [Sinanaerobacter sp. ZZT-01]WRR94881.1 winged helix-turn-helix transcriptional regulator [Sinanaerobacter sp. ZZT-01]
MKDELEILKLIEEKPYLSQRKIAEEIGISLGQVNFLIKKCVKKGFIKIEQQTAKSLRYNLTPKGMKEKAERTLQYIKNSYGTVIKLTEKIRTLSDFYQKLGKKIYIVGPEDEVMEIVKLALKEYSMAEVNLNQGVIFYWREESISKWKEKDTGLRAESEIEFVNILR